jgi:hypothetical protein
MAAITSFLTLLACRLGPGCYVTICPIFPAVMMAFEDLNCHTELHLIAKKNLNSQHIFFCRAHYRKELRPYIAQFNKVITEVFNKTRHLPHINEDEQFSFVTTQPLMQQRDPAVLQETMAAWIARVNEVMQRSQPMLAGLNKLTRI